MKYLIIILFSFLLITPVLAQEVAQQDVASKLAPVSVPVDEVGPTDIIPVTPVIEAPRGSQGSFGGGIDYGFLQKEQMYQLLLQEKSLLEQIIAFLTK